MLDVFNLLPSHVLWKVLSVWLQEWKYITKVDEAVCNHNTRSMFLTMLKSVRIATPMPALSAGTKLVEWIVKRKVLPANVRLSVSLLAQERFLESVGAEVMSIHISTTEYHMTASESQMAQVYWQIALHCPQLQALHLERVAVTGAVAVVLFKCPQLRKITCSNVDETVMLELVHICPNLEWLEVDCDVFQPAPILLLHNLRALHLHSTRFPGQDLVTNCSMISELTLADLTSNDMLVLASSCLHLESLRSTLRSSTNTSYDASVPSMVANWPNLRSLTLTTILYSKSNRLTDDSLLALVCGCTRLERVQVGGNSVACWADTPLPSDSALSAPGKSALRMLQVYTIKGTTMQSILAQCPGLEYISIDAAFDDLITTIAQSNIKRLRFGNDLLVTAGQLDSLMGLHSLELDYSDGPDSCVDLIALLQRSPNLTSLSVVLALKQISKLPAMVQPCAHLRELVVTDCNGDSTECKELAVGFLKIVCPKLVKMVLPFH